MIKKIFGLLIGTFVLLGSFSSAFNVQGAVPIGDNSTFFDGNICSIDTSLTISCSRSNRTITSLDSYHDNWISSIFWSSDGIGVYYDNPTEPYKNCQGLIKSNFFICQGNYNDLTLLGTNSDLSKCVNGFTKVGGLSYRELLGYLNGSTPLYYFNLNKAGFYGASLGFIYEDFYFIARVGGYDCGITNGSLTSQNLGFTGNTFSDINFNNPYVNFFPGNGQIYGSSNNSENVVLDGNLVTNVCTNGYVIDYLNKYEWGTAMRDGCYAGSYDTGNLVGVNSGYIDYIRNYGLNFKELFQLTNGGYSWIDWYNGNLDLINRYNKGSFGNVNPFAGSPVALYTYFENIYHIGYDVVGINGYDILNYCQLYLFSDYNAEYKGKYYKSVCDNLSYQNGDFNFTTGEVGTIDDDEILPPGFDISEETGNVIGIDWSGTLSGNTNKNFDGKNFINSFYQKLQSKFLKPTSGFVGIIPNYILVFMFALILFRFLQH